MKRGCSAMREFQHELGFIRKSPLMMRSFLTWSISFSKRIEYDTESAESSLVLTSSKMENLFSSNGVESAIAAIAGWSSWNGGARSGETSGRNRDITPTTICFICLSHLGHPPTTERANERASERVAQQEELNASLAPRSRYGRI